MKYIFLLLVPSHILAQTLDVDSLERKGYHVYVHKRHVRPKVVVRKKIIRDTVWRERMIKRHDTVRIYVLHERTISPQYVLLDHHPVVKQQQFDETFTLALVGTANTNGYAMHGGATLSIGARIKFFIGLGYAYNSVLKETRLDLGGHLVITLVH